MFLKHFDNHNIEIWEGKVAPHLILAEPVRVTACTRMTSRAGSQFTLNFTLHWSSHAPFSVVQRVLAFSKIAILWRLLQHHTSDNNEMVVEHGIDVKGLSSTKCSLWCREQKLWRKSVQCVNSEFIYWPSSSFFCEKLKNSDPRTTFLWQWRWWGGWRGGQGWLHSNIGRNPLHCTGGWTSLLSTRCF